MNILGIGPFLLIIGACAGVLVAGIEKLFHWHAALPAPWSIAANYAGVGLALIGLYFWISSARRVRRAFPSGRLETGGVYRLSRNPMYAAFIVFLVPGMACIVNDLLLLLISAAMGIGFKMRIPKEEEFLLGKYGDAYRQYVRKVAQLIPFVHV